jgi:hypothetical protein
MGCEHQLLPGGSERPPARVDSADRQAEPAGQLDAVPSGAATDVQGQGPPQEGLDPLPGCTAWPDQPDAGCRP